MTGAVTQVLGHEPVLLEVVLALEIRGRTGTQVLELWAEAVLAAAGVA